MKLLLAVSIAVAALMLFALIYRMIHRHYASVASQLSLSGLERPRAFRHTVILPVPAKPNRAVLEAAGYAQSISEDVVAVHVRTDQSEREEVLARWKKFVDDVPLVVLESPHYSVLRPLLRFIDEVRELRGDHKITVVLPEIVPERWWHNMLHNQTSLMLKGALARRPGIVVTSVAYRMQRGSGKRKEGVRKNGETKS